MEWILLHTRANCLFSSGCEESGAILPWLLLSTMSRRLHPDVYFVIARQDSRANHPGCLMHAGYIFSVRFRSEVTPEPRSLHGYDADVLIQNSNKMRPSCFLHWQHGGIKFYSMLKICCRTFSKKTCSKHRGFRKRQHHFGKI